MWRVVALLVGVLLLAGCSSTVDGRAESEADAASFRDGRATTGPTGAAGRSGTSDTSDTDSATAADPGTDAQNQPPTGPPPSGPSSAGPSSTEPPTVSAPELPPGFYGADTDLGYRPMSTDEFDCTPDQASGCFGIMVFSADGCPTGATVTVGIFDKAVDPTNPIGAATGVTPAIAVAGSQFVVIADSTGVAGQLTARVESVTC